MKDEDKTKKQLINELKDLKKRITELEASRTDNNSAEEVPRNTRNKYKTLIENLPQKIFYKDKNSVYVSCNSSYGRDLKINPDEITGKTDYDFHPIELAEKYRADDKRIMKSGCTETLDEEYTQDGKEMVVRTVKTPVKNNKGTIVGILGIFWDITEHKEAEKKVFEYQKRLKSLTAQITMNEEKERKRLAEYLHDQIGQELFVIKIKLEQLQDSLSYDEDLKILSDLSNNLIHTIDKTRSLTFELSPPILYQLGLEAALEWLAESTYLQYNVVVSFEDDKQEKPLDEEVKIFLYRAVRELLTNVAKHAQTQNAKVSIEKDNTHIRICVEDNGVGFIPLSKHSSKEKNKGFGLFSIKERLDQLGGYLEIKSLDGRGTQVSLTVPLKNKRKS